MENDLSREQMVDFNTLLDEAREAFPEHSDFALQFLCYKLAVDGNVNISEDLDEIEKVREKYFE